MRCISFFHHLFRSTMINFDRANGFIFGHLKNDDLSQRTNLMSNAFGVEQFQHAKTARIRENYMRDDDEEEED